MPLDTTRSKTDPNKSERILDKEKGESDEKNLEKEAKSQIEKLKTASEEENARSDNQNTSGRILDKADNDEEHPLP